MLSVFSIAILCMISPCATAFAANPESRGNDFDTKIAPLLAKRCLDCHNANEKKGGLDLSRSKTALLGGDSGAVIVPGQLDESLLWDYIDTDEMPPKHPLPANEKTLLKTWIASGAEWGSDPIDPFRFSTESRAGYDWWCLQPVVRPELPEVAAQDWVRNPIDRFILAKLESQQLGPANQADRRTLIRRLSFDLIGLPPTPAEIAAFVDDDSPDAYAKLVDRLLDSPHYGERWARHWLDVVRFGESQGFERDKLRDHAWPYRDWVVAAFNRDLPYDEFARMQLAGDVLNPSDPAALAATGMLVAGPYDEVGNSQQSAAMRAVVRQDELEGLVSSVGQTFLGLTVNCARCHDHKFDPVSQREYYRLTAALGGVRHGDRKIELMDLSSERTEQLKTAQAELDKLQREIAEITDPARKRILARRKAMRESVAPPLPMAEWRFDGDLRDSIGELHGESHGEARVEGGRLLLNGKDAYVSTAPLTVDLTAKTLEAWVSLENLKQQGGGVVSLQTHNGEQFDAIVFAERESRKWLAGSNHFARTKNFGGPSEQSTAEDLIHVAIVYRADGTIIGYRNGLRYGKPYRKSDTANFSAGDSQILFGLRHGQPGGNRMLAGTIDRARLYDRALSPAEIAASAGVENLFIDEEELLADAAPELRRQYEQLSFEMTNLRDQLERLRAKQIYANNPQAVPATHILNRGNPAQPGEVVVPGGIASLRGVNADFALSGDAPESDRRRKLAEWITSVHNPLFARVIVNRLWHYHFGVGIVDTPNDFGFNGGRPSHRQLIDWLAAELVAQRWSLKQMHRLIVTSATYRQAAAENPRAAELDADNRLCWQRTPRRLEAEAVRDAVLLVSGQLNRQVGGPGFHDFRTFVRNAQAYEMEDPVGQSFNRRSLYRTWVRSGRSMFLDVFDCPDPSTKTPARSVTTTPLQALSMMNNSFVLRMADHFAERLRTEQGTDVTAQIQGAYLLAFGRRADSEETQLGSEFIAAHGLPAYCRVLFNSSEFLYVD